MQLLYKKIANPYLIIATFTLVCTLLLWLPFVTKLPNVGNIKLNGASSNTILSSWDGPLYIIVAKTFYNPAHEIFIEPPLGYAASYFPAHLPLYPLTIKMLSGLMSYPQAMIVSTVLSSILLFWLFYYFVKKHELSNHPLLLTLLLSLWPRLWVVRSVGSPEPLFLALILSSVFMFMEKRYLFASILGGLAVFTKTPGVLLFPAFGAYFLVTYLKNKTFTWSSLSILLIPLSLLGVFAFFEYRMGDFLAYYHTNAVVPMSGLFASLNSQVKWVGTAWLEDIVFLFLLLTFTTITLVSRHIKDKSNHTLVIACFMTMFLIPLSFVEHRDISRYALPLIPFVFIVFQKFLTDKKFLTACAIILPAIYLYAINFLLQNSAPIADWAPFL